MSIFSGWDAKTLRMLAEAASASPMGLGILAGLGLIGVLCVVLIGFYLSHKVSDFMVRVQQEDEAARDEEEARGENRSRSTEDLTHTEPKEMQE